MAGGPAGVRRARTEGRGGFRVRRLRAPPLAPFRRLAPRFARNDGLWPGTGRFGGARPNPRCWGPRLPRPCHFPAIRSSYSGLFNGLRAIQIKKRCSPFSLLLLRSPPRPAGRKRRERNDFDRADTRPSPPGRRPENKYRTTVALSRNSRSFCRRGSTPLPLQLRNECLAPRASKAALCASNAKNLFPSL